MANTKSSEDQNAIRRQAKARQKAQAHAAAQRNRRSEGGGEGGLTALRKENAARMKALRFGRDVSAAIDSWLDMADTRRAGVLVTFSTQEAWGQAVYDQAILELRQWLKGGQTAYGYRELPDERLDEDGLHIARIGGTATA